MEMGGEYCFTTSLTTPNTQTIYLGRKGGKMEGGKRRKKRRIKWRKERR